MIINCPSCSKPMSSQAPMCPSCGFARGEVSDEDLLEFRRRRLRDRIYHLNMASYTVIAVFLAAFGWYWWSTAGFEQPSASGPVALLGVGIVGYATVRVLLFLAKRQMKALRRAE